MFLKPELAAPAGDLEKLKTAVLFGADAVYAGGQNFSLRAAATNFTEAEMAEGIAFAHKYNKKLYVTVNIYAHDKHLQKLPAYLQSLQEMGVDALIISDPGIFQIARETVPQMPVHISTQANCTNTSAAVFWQKLGAKRIVLARELSIAESAQIAKNAEIELEMFVHGAMCMAISGRCLLSSFMAKRGANLGDCAQPCRWEYHLEEKKREGSYFPIEEDRWGSYIFNSKDLCLIEYLPQIMMAGIKALKIEGRMKSAYYVANIVRIYRQAIDACWNDPEGYFVKNKWKEELSKVSHRQYTTGFATGELDSEAYVYDTGYSFRGYDFAGVVLGYEEANKRILIEQRNHLALGDEIEIISPFQEIYTTKITAIWDTEGNPREKLPHPKEKAYIACEKSFTQGSIIRRLTKDVF